MIFTILEMQTENWKYEHTEWYIPLPIRARTQSPLALWCYHIAWRWKTLLYTYKRMRVKMANDTQYSCEYSFDLSGHLNWEVLGLRNPHILITTILNNIWAAWLWNDKGAPHDETGFEASHPQLLLVSFTCLKKFEPENFV